MAFFEQASETLPRELLRAVQLQKLQANLSQIYERNRFYANKWNEAGALPNTVRSFADFQKLPFTRKSELVKAQEEPLDIFSPSFSLRSRTTTPSPGWPRFAGALKKSSPIYEEALFWQNLNRLTKKTWASERNLHRVVSEFIASLSRHTSLAAAAAT